MSTVLGSAFEANIVSISHSNIQAWRLSGWHGDVRIEEMTGKQEGAIVHEWAWAKHQKQFCLVPRWCKTLNVSLDLCSYWFHNVKCSVYGISSSCLAVHLLVQMNWPTLLVQVRNTQGCFLFLHSAVHGVRALTPHHPSTICWMTLTAWLNHLSTRLE